MKPRSDVRLSLRKRGTPWGTGEPQGHTFDYARLMRVSMRNTYYDPPYGCSAFAATPTPFTAQFMGDAGLLFLREQFGFSVVYDRANAHGLFSILRRQKMDGKFEARLSFTLALTEPSFETFTVLPAGFRPNAKNFFFSNENAHDTGGRVVLSRGDWPGGDDLLPVVASQVPLRVTQGIAFIEVKNTFGRVVILPPQKVPPHTEALLVDLSPLPHDAYVIQPGPAITPPVPETALYTVPRQFAFIDLLFSAPTLLSGGIYPIDGLDTDDPAASLVEYSIVFEHRSKQWRYYVVPPPRRRFDGLSIETEPPGFAVFRGPAAATLPNGQAALLFESIDALPLREVTPARFILNSDDGIVMRSMPVAPADQWSPDHSDIYVYV
ncbi:MAG TPA: hypothetical protein VGJ81_20885 [Thermoanaerobaculia bacterium]|jgi:hypothetical protein